MTAADLFSKGDAETWRFRVIRRAGSEFLLLPRRTNAAITGLSLYPAQTLKARLLRGACALLLRAGLPRAAATLRIAKNDPLREFLAQLGGVAEPAILAGNPNAPGQRFVIVPFDNAGHPICVIKAGRGDLSAARIEQESRFLHSAPSATGIPKLLGSVNAGDLRALATPFIFGTSPTESHDRLLRPTLDRWIDTTRTVRVAEMPVWRRLQFGGSATTAGRLADSAIHPAIIHGDFAPWNARVGNDGHMYAFDWENGELCGLPGWDWIHYVASRAVLVHRSTPEAIADEVASLVESADFLAHLGIARVEGIGRAIALACLQHIVHVARPTEGLEHFSAILHSLTNRWPRA